MPSSSHCGGYLWPSLTRVRCGCWVVAESRLLCGLSNGALQLYSTKNVLQPVNLPSSHDDEVRHIIPTKPGAPRRLASLALSVCGAGEAKLWDVKNLASDALTTLEGVGYGGFPRLNLTSSAVTRYLPLLASENIVCSTLLSSLIVQLTLTGKPVAWLSAPTRLRPPSKPTFTILRRLGCR